jgi:hypothetical protein
LLLLALLVAPSSALAGWQQFLIAYQCNDTGRSALAECSEPIQYTWATFQRGFAYMVVERLPYGRIGAEFRYVDEHGSIRNIFFSDGEWGGHGLHFRYLDGWHETEQRPHVDIASDNMYNRPNSEYGIEVKSCGIHIAPGIAVSHPRKCVE